MIRPALVDVLMEKEVAFTPTQRLIFTVGQLLIAKIMMLVKFIRAKSADLKEFRQMHEENKEQRNTIIRQQEEIRKQNEEILKMRNEQAKAQTQNQSKVANEEEEEEEEVEQPTLDDALNTDTTTEVENEGQENDIP
jgi:septal ring factor EnvC (AmiA/AmiB activator)